MTRDEIIEALATVERVLADRVFVVRVIIAPDGKELRRIYRCSFQQPPGSHVGELHQKGRSS